MKVDIRFSAWYQTRGGLVAQAVLVGLDSINNDNRMYAQMRTGTTTWFVTRAGRYDFHGKEHSLDLMFEVDMTDTGSFVPKRKD